MLRITGAESVQILVQIPSSVDRGGAIGVLPKIQLATQGDRAAAVIGEQAYGSQQRGGGSFVAGRENIGEYRHDSRSQRRARTRKRCNNKSPGFRLRFTGWFLLSRWLCARILNLGRRRRRNGLGPWLGLWCRCGPGSKTPKQSACEEKREDPPRSSPVHGWKAHLGPSDRTSIARPAPLHLRGGPCGLGHWMSRGTNCLFCGPNCFSLPLCAGVWASAK